MGTEDESLIAKLGSHGQDDPYVKSTQKSSSQHRQADFHETCDVAFGNPAHLQPIIV